MELISFNDITIYVDSGDKLLLLQAIGGCTFSWDFGFGETFLNFAFV